METTARKSVAPFYAVAVLWLVWGALFPLYAVTHYVLLAAVSVGVFFAVNALCRSGGAIGGTEEAAPKKEEKPKEASTGNPEVDKMLKDGGLAIAEMKRLDDNIADPGISADIVRLEQVSQKIFDEVKRDPKKLPQIRKFMDYYLPTTLKLLNAYDRMSGAGAAQGADDHEYRRRRRCRQDIVQRLVQRRQHAPGQPQRRHGVKGRHRPPSGLHSRTSSCQMLRIKNEAIIPPEQKTVNVKSL